MELQRDLPLLVGLALAMGMAVFLAAAETALLRTPAVRVTTLAGRSRRGRRLAALVDRLPEVLSSILLGALLSQIGAATIVGILAARWFGSLGVTVSSVVLTVVLFIYAEAIPKTYAVRHPEQVAVAVAYPVTLLAQVLKPVVSVLTWIADLQMPGHGVTTSPTITEGELRSLATSAAREGEITHVDRELIERAFRFGDRRVDDVMVPRPDIVAVAGDASVGEAMAVVIDAGHRRIPVYEGSIENITGVVRLRHLAGVPEERRNLVEAGAIADEPLVVPESKRIFPLLTEMQQTGIHLAVVVDEFGGTAGIVTLEDIAEELLGSLRAEPVAEAIVALGDGRWSVDASLPVEDLVELTGEPLPAGDWNTVAGLVMALAGSIPEFGEVVSAPGFELRVSGMRGRRITRVVVSAKG